MATETISATQLHKVNKRDLLATVIEKASYVTISWSHLGTITATDYVYIGALPDSSDDIDVTVVDIKLGAESLDAASGDETYTVGVYKDDACDAAAGTSLCDTVTLTRSTDNGVVKTATLTSAAIDIDTSSHPILKAKFTLGGTTPIMTNPWITVTVKTVKKIEK